MIEGIVITILLLGAIFILPIKNSAKKLRRKFFFKTDDRWNDDYKKWRQRVKAKRGEKCEICGAKNNLEVHHIKPWNMYPRDRYKVRNGMVLCKKHHVELHATIGNKYQLPLHRDTIRNMKRKNRYGKITRSALFRRLV